VNFLHPEEEHRVNGNPRERERERESCLGPWEKTRKGKPGILLLFEKKAEPIWSCLLESIEFLGSF
jgi:hypothetical protein